MKIKVAKYLRMYNTNVLYLPADLIIEKHLLIRIISYLMINILKRFILIIYKFIKDIHYYAFILR
jgi:hypothetical protein